MFKRALVFAVVLPLSSACFVRGGGGLFFAVAETALITAAIVSATEPPPPRVVFVPEPRPGYAWQPGYWTVDHDNWVWVDGSWVALQPGYAWVPAHWEHAPDGTWQLIAGHWVAAGPSSQPPAPQPMPAQAAPPPPPPPPPPHDPVPPSAPAQ